MLLPEPDQATLSRRDEIVAALKRLVPEGCVIDDDTTMAAFDTDGLSAYRNQPLVVVLPETTQQVAEVMRWCRDHEVKIVLWCGNITVWRGHSFIRWCLAGFG